jgi:hypothetical protein
VARSAHARADQIFSGAAEFTTFLQATLGAGSRNGRGAERDDELLRCRRSADAGAENGLVVREAVHRNWLDEAGISWNYAVDQFQFWMPLSRARGLAKLDTVVQRLAVEFPKESQGQGFHIGKAGTLPAGAREQVAAFMAGVMAVAFLVRSETPWPIGLFARHPPTISVVNQFYVAHRTETNRLEAYGVLGIVFLHC